MAAGVPRRLDQTNTGTRESANERDQEPRGADASEPERVTESGAHLRHGPSHPRARRPALLPLNARQTARRRLTRKPPLPRPTRPVAGAR